MNSRKFAVDSNHHGKRIDVALFELCGDLSRRKVRQILDVGGVYVNNRRIRIASRTVQTGDQLRMEYSLAAIQKLRHQSFEFADKDILYEDTHLMAINKFPGLPAQATKDQSVLHVSTLAKSYLQKQGRPCPQLEICHRLDKETSGVMMLAKHKDSLKWMMELFKNQNVKKNYEALVYGIPKQDQFEVRNYLSTINPKNGVVSVVRSGGKPAFTEFQVVRRFAKNNIAVVNAFPKTGRTHQIRVHLLSAGYPIVGDKIYASDEQRNSLPPLLGEQASFHHMLHAKEIGFPKFRKPEETLTIIAPRPPAFTALLELI